jgi:hypothetical protein
MNRSTQSCCAFMNATFFYYFVFEQLDEWNDEIDREPAEGGQHVAGSRASRAARRERVLRETAERERTERQNILDGRGLPSGFWYVVCNHL